MESHFACQRRDGGDARNPTVKPVRAAEATMAVLSANPPFTGESAEEEVVHIAADQPLPKRHKRK